VLKEEMLDMPGADEFCICDSHLEGEEVFGSTKRKPDLPLGDDGESRRPDTMNYSRSRALKRAALSRVASLRVISEEKEIEASKVIASPVIPSSPPVLEGGIKHITVVQESTVNERLWQIARLSKKSAKSCWAMRAVTKKKCNAKIVHNSTNTPAPTYTGEWLNMRLGREISEQFFFCPDDIERCVKGNQHKWVRHFLSTEPRPPIPDVWPVKLGTNLKLKEIQALEAAGFQLPQKIQVSPRRLFSMHRCLHICPLS
jgi:hypothetical protein